MARVPIFHSLVSTNPVTAKRQAQMAAYLPAGVSLADFDQREQELIDQALQLGATPAMLNTVLQGRVSPNYTLPTAASQHIPFGSEFDDDFNSRYVPDQRSAREILSSSTNPFALIGKGVGGVADAVSYLANLRAPAYDPVANRQATQSLINQRAVDTDILQDEYNLDKERRIADADISQYLPNMSLPDMSLPDSSYDLGAAVRAAPADIARHLMYPVNRASIAVENVGTDILDSDFVGGLTGRKEGVTYTEAKDKAKSKLSSSGTTDDKVKKGATGTTTIDPSISSAVNDPLGLGTAKIQTKLKDTTALDKSEGKGSGADNWFDAVNERVDLMAMGAAMLAGSSSGEGTLANLGRGLQAGIASRKDEATIAEAKKYKDATLALALMREQSNRRKNDIAAAASNQLTFRESVDALSSELQVAGADEGNTKVISQYMLGNPKISGYLRGLDHDSRQFWIKNFVSVGQGWTGDEIEKDNVNKAINRATKKLMGTK